MDSEEVFIFLIRSISFKYLLKNIGFNSYSYLMIMAYISFGDIRSVITCDFDCQFLISAKTRAHLCRTILYWEDILSKEDYASQFKELIIHFLLMMTYSSVIWVGVGPEVSLHIFKFSVSAWKIVLEKKKILDIRHFFSAGHICRIYYFYLCLFVHSCLLLCVGMGRVKEDSPSGKVVISVCSLLRVGM